MNPKLKPLQGRRLSTWLSWLVISAQILALLSTVTVGTLQPTPQMAVEAAQQAGLSGWLVDAATGLLQLAQPLWGTLPSAQAQSALVPPVINASPDNVSFGSVSVGSTSVTQTVTIANIANAGSTISGGGFTTCAVTSSGGVKCWGWNGFGQLGDGTNYNRTAPVDVIGLETNVVTVQNGFHHTCALTTGGGVKCWGYNGNGQLGDNSRTSRNVPVDVVGLTSGALAISVGQQHTCALTNKGAVKCWGWNGLGALGDATYTDSQIPVTVNGFTTGASAIAAGEYFNCALTTSGGVKCWGYNGEGQLGDGTNTLQRTPAEVSGLTSGVRAISAGQNWACAVTSAGAAKCWGYNGQGQLGDGSNANRNTPGNVSGLTSGVSTIEAGLHHTCALTSSGGVKCWGYNADGQLGDGGNTQRSVPADVAGLTSGVSAIGAGYYHSCAVLSSGGVKCWGYNGYGQLGDGTVYNRNLPINTDGQPVLFATPALTAASAGGLNTCAVTASGGAKCWGYNDLGQIGNGAFHSWSQAPMDVVGLSSGVTALANNYFHTCAIVNGAAKCWGHNDQGQLGNGSTTRSNVPVNVSGLSSGVTAIATGEFFSCAVVNGGVKCWGYGAYGQLGNGATGNSSVPVNVSGLTSGVSAIGAGNYHACAALTAGGVKCWGYNANGQLGNGTTSGVNPVPVTVSGLNSTVVTALTADWEHTCALTSSGGAKCWGYNGNGQLGDGSTTARNTPVDVSGLTSGVTALDTGFHHTCALTASGGVKCWGYNGHGQVGDNTTNQRNTAVDVSGLTSGATALAVGRYHSCATLTDGNMKCWGYGGLGQLGDGFYFNRYKPGDVSTLIADTPDLVDDLSITNISLLGVDAGEFSIVGGSCGSTFPITLARGAGCTVLLKANPTGTGTKTASLAVNSDDGAQPIINVALDLTTADPDIDVSPSSLTFGNINLGTTSPTQFVTVRNVAPAGGVIRSGPFSNHACAITNVGGVKCWGYNNAGQLGDGTNIQRLAPVDVTGLITGVTSLAVGDMHSCALTSAGGVKCWGYNNLGQLGYSTTPADRSNIPQDVTGLTSGVNAIAAGSAYTCALLNNGGVKCWGYNNVGQLGFSTAPAFNTSTPGDVTGLTSGVSAIAAGENHTCALLSSGGIKCWGYNNVGQLGYSTTPAVFTATPGDVTGLTSGVSAIALGRFHTCAVTTSGGAKCWGYNNVGQLGDGTTTQRATPADVTSLTSGVATLAAGEFHTCALLTSKGLKCWGYNNVGQLGDGGTTTRNIPADVTGLTSGVDALTAGLNFTCATTLNGGGRCWGYNLQGQLGDGTNTQRTKAVAVVGQPYLFATMTNAAAAGGFSTCAITANKGAKCWGNDEYQHAGANDGSSATRYGPVDVSGLLSGTAQIATARYHACAVLTDGAVKCWGHNGQGRLGDGSTIDRVAPTDVSGFGSGSGGSLSEISGGGQTTCATTSTGGVKCWGWNGYGQVGDGATFNRSAPVNVTGLTSGATAVENSLFHTCALVSGGVKCWGYNGEGQLGDGTNAQRTTPVTVSGLSSGVSALATGQRHTCALTTGGGVKCWGWNGYGQLGDGSTTNSNTPVDVSGLTSGVIALSASELSTCALTSSGGVKCWGWNGYGQLGFSTAPFDRSTTPGDVTGLTSGVSAIEASEFYHTCALTTGGGMKCWGYNGYGQLGYNTFPYDRSGTPQDVTGLTSGVSAMKAGRLHTCAITTGGAMKCWGYNGYGQLGDGTTTQRNTPTDVSGLSSGVSKIATGEYHTCALTSSGAQCWGFNGYGQLGDGSTFQRNTPTAVAVLVSGVTAVATGFNHTCALTSAGAVKCWGYNGYGQLGDGTTTDRTAPVQVTGLTSGITAIAVGNGFSCALNDSGGVQCWGRNEQGRLGDGSTTNRTTPVDVNGLTSGVSAIGASHHAACAAMTGGGVKCWGYNNLGQLGNGSTTESHVPVDVSGLSGVTVSALRGGELHTCALTSSGGVKCWGYNNLGQLGYGTAPAFHSTVPNDVTGLTSGVTSLAAGDQHTCAIVNTGDMYCWGYNGNGELGDGTNLQRSTPNEVATLINGVAGTIGALNVTGIYLKGGDASHFAISSGGTCSTSFPFTLAAGAGCTVPLVFSPLSYGVKNTNLIVTSNDPLSPTIPVALTGTAVGPDLKIRKNGPANAVQGTAFSYTLVISNTGNSATSGTITVSDTLPSDVSFVSGSGGGFACSASGQAVTCTSSASLAISATATINLNVTPSGLGALANSAHVGGAGDPTLDTSASANTFVAAPPPDLTTVIGQPAPNLVSGLSSSIPITVANSGAGPSAGVITATLTLPTGVSAPATFTDGTWTCRTSGQTVTCVQPNALLPGQSSTVHVPVTPGISTIGTQPVFNGTVATDVETITSNNAATPMTPNVAVVTGDTDRDGILDTAECPTLPCADTDGDTVPNYLEPNNKDTDGDGTPNFNDPNDDGDATGTSSENPGGGLTPADTDGDQIPDYLDPVNGAAGTTGGDSDGDGLADALECPTLPCLDSDGDGKPNYLDADDDGDGIPTATEGITTDTDGDSVPDYLESNNKDLDGDGLMNYNDPDDDGDTVNTVAESPGGGLTPTDSDGDKIPDYLDPVNGAPGSNGGDSDGDGVADALECPLGVACPDSDGDGKPNYLDSDDDGDGLPTATEGATTDTDGDSVPDYLEPNTLDTDGDGLLNDNDPNDDGDATNTSGENPGGGLNPTDSDGDKIPDYLDKVNGAPGANGGDSDGDGLTDSAECPNGIPCPDADNNGVPDYMQPASGAAVILPVKVLLQGAYNSSTGLMNDNLRSLASFPLTSPYGDGATITNTSVLTANNIVDWVLIELRGTGAVSTTVAASKGALLQRDGDVVATDGVSTLSFTGLAGSSYHVVVKHRNHLGIMTANPVTLNASTPTVDFTNPATPVFVRTRTVAQKSQSGKLLMWGGDANGDGDVKGAGPGTDPGAVRLAVLGHPGNTSFLANYVAAGYAKADVTLNGTTIGAGPGNEISNLILPNVLTHPGNPTAQNNYIICQQLPEDPCN